MAGQWVEIEFDCLPLRSVTRLDVPVDASPVYEQFVLRVKEAMAQHGSHNTYYLHRGRCSYHLTNDPGCGRVSFKFEGTVMKPETRFKLLTHCSEHKTNCYESTLIMKQCVEPWILIWEPWN